MKLSAKATKELQKIIKNDYGQIINKEEANDLGGRLLRLTRLALKHQVKTDKKDNIKTHS